MNPAADSVIELCYMCQVPGVLLCWWKWCRKLGHFWRPQRGHINTHCSVSAELFLVLFSTLLGSATRLPLHKITRNAAFALHYFWYVFTALLHGMCQSENGEWWTAGFVACCVRRICCLLCQYLTTSCFVASISWHWFSFQETPGIGHHVYEGGIQKKMTKNPFWETLGA
jgi:hypothetical protein